MSKENFRVGEGVIRKLMEMMKDYINAHTSYAGGYVGDVAYIYLYQEMERYLQERGFEEKPVD